MRRNNKTQKKLPAPEIKEKTTVGIHIKRTDEYPPFTHIVLDEWEGNIMGGFLNAYDAARYLFYLDSKNKEGKI